MFAKNPVKAGFRPLDPSMKEHLQAIRLAIIAELDAINFYEQVAVRCQNPDIRKVFEDVAKEEKEHLGEFLALLVKHDPTVLEKMREGFKEVESLIGFRVDINS